MAKEYSGVVMTENIGSVTMDFYEHNIVGRSDYRDRVEKEEIKKNNGVSCGRNIEYFWSERPKVRSKLIKIMEDEFP